MQYILCLETILALDIMHIFQWNEKRAKSQLETLKFFSFTLLMLGFTTTKAKANDELHNDVRTNSSSKYVQEKTNESETYFSSSIWIAWYQPIPRLGAPQPTRITSACPSLASLIEFPPKYRVAVLETTFRLTNPAALRVAIENMIVVVVVAVFKNVIDFIVCVLLVLKVEKEEDTVR